MKSLRFRVWDGEKFLYSSYSVKDRECVSLKVEGGILPFLGREDYHENFVIQQFTGLRDRENREVYEGDVVKFYRWMEICQDDTTKFLQKYLCDGLKKVTWGLDNGGEYPNAGFTVVNLKEDKEGHILNWMDQKNMKVVGNIFETPSI